MTNSCSLRMLLRGCGKWGTSAKSLGQEPGSPRSQPLAEPLDFRLYPLLILHGIRLPIFPNHSGGCGTEAEPSSPKWESKTFLWADICWKVKWLWIGLALGKGRCEASARFCKSSFFVAKQDHFWVKMTSDQGQPERSDVKIVLYSS